ncbi:MAG: PaaI family thioesterase [Roseovarius sp.]|nr:PaaI family thioesterase [Roseovarius sp.]
MDSIIQPRIQNSFDAQTMMKTLGARLLKADDGLAEIETPILFGSLQQHGYAHACLAFAIGDSAAGYAALSLMPDDHEVLTTEIKINLLAPATGNLLVACGSVIKPGKRLVIVQSDVFSMANDQKTHVAHLVGTMIPVPKQAEGRIVRKTINSR